jgi:signal transduction histidine kinase
MKKPSKKDENSLRDKIMGFGEKSMRKSYYPQLLKRIKELEEYNQKLEDALFEKEKISAELLENKATLAEIIDNQPLGIYRLHLTKDANLQNGIKNVFSLDFMNQNFKNLLEIPSDVRDNAFTLTEIVLQEDRDDFIKQNDEAIRHFSTFSWLGRITTTKGIKWVKLQSYPRLLPSGDRVWTGMSIDMTESVRSQQLEQELLIAKKSAEFKQNFLANMSHEIRTPLTGIEGMAHILSQTTLSESQQEYLEVILDSAQNLREIINQILDYSKLEAGQMMLKKRVFSTQEFVNKISKMFVSLCNQKIPYKLLVPEKLPAFIETDEQKIIQIVTNFVSNAVKYGEGGLIVFELQKQEIPNSNKIEFKILVTDSGKGIKPEMADKIFTPFSQLEQKDQRTIEGTGLGLSISKDLAKILDGKIGVISEPEKGSTFWFTFSAIVKRESLTEIKTPRIQSPKGGKQNILLVEDKIVNQKVITLILNKLGHTVTIASNGSDALEVFQPNEFDLILMDIQMPVMDGITATQQLRKDYDNLPPIIGLSANAFEGDREKYINRGMDDYLTKPVSPAELQRVIEKWQTLV